MVMQRTVEFYLRSHGRKKRKAFTLSSYHAPEPGILVRLGMNLAIILVAAAIGLAIGGLPLNRIVLPLLPLVGLTLIIVWILPENSRPPTPSSEERRVGKEGVSPCSSRWSPYH